MRSAWLLFRLGSGATAIVSKCCHSKEKIYRYKRKGMKIKTENYNWHKEHDLKKLQMLKREHHSLPL